MLLEKEVNPNVQDKSGKTPLHYATENDCLQAIELLLKAKADQNVDDSADDCSNSSGDDSQAKPAELSNCNTEEDLGYGSGDSRENEENQAKSLNNENRTFIDQQTSSESLEVSNSSTKLPLKKGADLNVHTPSDKDSSHSSDDSYENEENAATPDDSVDDCSNSSGDDSQIESVKLSDCNTEEDSNCSSSDNLCNDDKNDNEKDDKETVTNLILEEEEIEGVLSDRVKSRDGTKEYIERVNDITDQDDEDKDEALDIIESNTSNLLLEGGKAKEEFFSSGSDTELA